MADNDDYAKRTARIKNLLSSYYGDAAPGAGGGAAGGSSAGGAGSSGSQPGSPVAAAGGGSPLAAARGGPGPPGAAAPTRFGPAAAAAFGAGGSALSMDSPAFNPDLHLQQMLRGLPLERLLAEHRGMAREIKNLDSDMQQLVYENYNKFITATDTIKAMKASVDAMDPDMDRLKSIMDDVGDRSGSVNAKLLRQRQTCEELRRVGDVLKRLQALFGLPCRMRAALEEDALDSAVDFYADAAPLLAKYGSRGALRSVATDAEAAAREVGAVLKRRLAERRDDAERTVLLLRRLGEGDESLQDKYLQGRLERMHRILSEAAAVAGAMASAGGGPPPTSALTGPISGEGGAPTREAWAFGPDGAPPPLGAFVRLLDERLFAALQETVVNVSSIFLQGDSSAAASKPLLRVAKEVMGQYFRVIRRASEDAGRAAAEAAARLREAEAGGGSLDLGGPAFKFGEDWGTDEIAQAMAMVTADIAQLHPQLPSLALPDYAAAATEHAVRAHVAAAGAAVRARAALAMRLACSVAGLSGGSGGGAFPGGGGGDGKVPPLAAAFACASEAMHRCTLAMLQGLRAYQQRYARLLGLLLPQVKDAVAADMAKHLGGLASACLAAGRVREGAASPGWAATGAGGGGAGSGGGAGPVGVGGGSAVAADPPKTGLLLLLARLCLFLEGTTVPAVMEELAMHYPGSSGDPDAAPPFVAGDVARRLGSAGQLLLGAFVEAHGRALSLAVERGTAAFSWLNANEARAPRPMCDLLLERLGRAEGEVVTLVEATGRAPGADGARRDGGVSAHHRSGGSASDRDPSYPLGSGAVERGVARLFRTRAKISAPVRFTQAALLGAIAASGLKSLVECVRLQTLGPAGLRQLQLDAAYLRPRLTRAAGGGGGAGGDAVLQLLEEAVAAGLERATDPGALLEPEAVDRILTAAGDGEGSGGGGP